MKAFCIALLILSFYLWKVISGLHKLKESKAPNFQPYHGQNTSTDGAYNYSQYQPFEKVWQLKLLFDLLHLGLNPLSRYCSG